MMRWGSIYKTFEYTYTLEPIITNRLYCIYIKQYLISSSTG